MKKYHTKFISTIVTSTKKKQYNETVLMGEKGGIS